MTNPAPGVTVGGLLQSRPEAVGLDLDLLAGSGGLERRITSPYVQKTGLALAGFETIQAKRARAGEGPPRSNEDKIDESEVEDVPDAGEQP